MIEDLTAVQRCALDWIALATSGKATEEDIAAMGRWRDARPEHAEALSRLSAFVKIAKIKPRPETAHLKAPIYQRPMTRRFILGGAAAAGISYSVVNPPLAMWPSLADLSSDYRTAVGERKSVQLAQGLFVQLNTRTSVSLHNRPTLPGIDLISGEVAVKTNLPGSMQFTAYLPRTRVLARQASFDVRRTSEGFRTTCIEGEILVQRNGRQVVVSAGQGLTCHTDDQSLGTPASIETASVTAWQRGQLVFFDAPLSEVVAEINRYRRGRIIILSSGLTGRRINANLWIDQLDNMDALLATFGHASATSLPGSIILLT